MIYYDPTEARKCSKVKAATIAAARPCEHLEKYTGADFLIDPFDDMPLPDKLLDIPPHMIALEEHCQHGVLIQRKSGRDLLSSIADLESIQARMNAMSPQSWLVPVGIAKSGESAVAVYGRKVKNWKWATVEGAFVAWRLRGGSVAPEVKNEQDLTKLFRRIEFKVREYYSDPSKSVAQKGHVQSVKLIDRNWLNTLSAWPTGIGTKNLYNVAKFVDTRGHEPSLVNVARAILSGQAEKVYGWGKKRIAMCREWWGVDHDRPLDVIVVPLGEAGQSADLAQYPKDSICLPHETLPREGKNDRKK